MEFTGAALTLKATSTYGLDDDFVCPGGQVVLKPTSGTAPFTFYRGATLLGTSNDSLFDTPTAAGTYTYTVADARVALPSLSPTLPIC